MTPSDRQFVLSGWSTSMRGSRDLPLIPMRDYAAIMHPVIDGYLDHPTVLTHVAEGDGGVLRGFVSADSTRYSTRMRGGIVELAGYVYYLYVAAPFRGWKIARALLAAIGIEPSSRFGYAMRTRSSFEVRAKIPLAEYDPYRARFLTTESNP